MNKTYIIKEQGRTVEVWYDRYLKLWTAYRIDENGYQISDAIYDTDKQLAAKFAGYAECYR